MDSKKYQESQTKKFIIQKKLNEQKSKKECNLNLVANFINSISALREQQFKSNYNAILFRLLINQTNIFSKIATFKYQVLWIKRFIYQHETQELKNSISIYSDTLDKFELIKLALGLMLFQNKIENKDFRQLPHFRVASYNPGLGVLIALQPFCISRQRSKLLTHSLRADSNRLLKINKMTNHLVMTDYQFIQSKFKNSKKSRLKIFNPIIFLKKIFKQLQHTQHKVSLRIVIKYPSKGKEKKVWVFSLISIHFSLPSNSKKLGPAVQAHYS
ncbi:unnamed protein product [Paramecium pentaurelia]|uniref:Uncharacterized protein n=1 Tax=Paramecium pentaurelia TaxID=43138 RepID=A0A8S1VMJ7_9CILI|nr:unnamed protein product [Paramecium pentaurelia]